MRHSPIRGIVIGLSGALALLVGGHPYLALFPITAALALAVAVLVEALRDSDEFDD